ncbi:tetrahydrofolate dehydrogenase/cyclohydrolase catalytic domain-containing protein [Paenibacillus physcomitrellae]|uniref:tetrahydrofolate dehydrogenase/cyclohydrolase catalytic domain-containing protein n=1 Tax=Paenibacillus physcomitrellae TaxID=1619311 RepID=UPI002467F360|nr:tetrahydrofolate dehydrogenase/cyclohydrolase catalytic domain-containing protein [Paenibacillus physcomitrellae]
MISRIKKLNNDPCMHGILLRHPVPDHIDERAAFDAINTGKDVDGITTITNQIPD